MQSPNDSPTRYEGRKRPVMQHNYHTMTNNAVLPPDELPDVVHYHSKVLKKKSNLLAPTLRNINAQETAQIYQGKLNMPVNISPYKTIEPETAHPSLATKVVSQFLTEYQSRMLGHDQTELKKKTSKKLITPLFQRHLGEQNLGTGLVVQGKQKDTSIYNAQTLSRYNGRKRQFNEYSYAHESAAIREARERVRNKPTIKIEQPSKGNFHYNARKASADLATNVGPEPQFRTVEVRNESNLHSQPTTNRNDDMRIQNDFEVRDQYHKKGVENSSSLQQSSVSNKQKMTYASQPNLHQQQQQQQQQYPHTDIRVTDTPLVIENNQQLHQQNKSIETKEYNIMGAHGGIAGTLAAARAQQQTQNNSSILAANNGTNNRNSLIAAKLNAISSPKLMQNSEQHLTRQSKAAMINASQFASEQRGMGGYGSQLMTRNPYYADGSKIVAGKASPHQQLQLGTIENQRHQSQNRLTVANGGENYGIMDQKATQSVMQADPSLVMMRYYQNQEASRNGAAGVPRNLLMSKHQSQQHIRSNGSQRNIVPPRIQSSNTIPNPMKNIQPQANINLRSGGSTLIPHSSYDVLVSTGNQPYQQQPQYQQRNMMPNRLPALAQHQQQPNNNQYQFDSFNNNQFEPVSIGLF